MNWTVLYDWSNGNRVSGHILVQITKLHTRLRLCRILCLARSHISSHEFLIIKEQEFIQNLNVPTQTQLMI